MRSIKQLLVSAVILSGCAGMPTPPAGDMYLHKGQIALCSDMETGDACPKIPLSATENFVMFSPETWNNIQTYIDALIRTIQQKGSPGFFAPTSSEKDEQLNALYKIKFAMRSAERNWRKRK